MLKLPKWKLLIEFPQYSAHFKLLRDVRKLFIKHLLQSASFQNLLRGILTQ